MKTKLRKYKRAIIQEDSALVTDDNNCLHYLVPNSDLATIENVTIVDNSDDTYNSLQDMYHIIIGSSDRWIKLDIESIKSVLHATDKNNSRIVFQGVWFIPSIGYVGCDSKRLESVETVDNFDHEFIIPIEIIRACNKGMELFYNPEDKLFRTNNIYASKIYANIPRVEHIIPINDITDNYMNLDADKFKKAVQEYVKFNSDVNIVFMDNKIQVLKNYDVITEIEFDYTYINDKPIKFKVQYIYDFFKVDKDRKLCLCNFPRPSYSFDNNRIGLIMSLKIS